MGTADHPDSTPHRSEPTRLIPLARTIARARLPHRGVAYRGRRQGVADGRGVARVPKDDEATTLLKPSGAAARPVFVDDTGRRGRLLTWAMVGLALIAVLLIAAFWFSQATASGAPSVGV
jgi:hypothetical protein